MALGIAERTAVLASGTFWCPCCASSQGYRHLRSRRYLVLWFQPIVPLEKGVEYIECSGCHGTFVPAPRDGPAGSPVIVRAASDAKGERRVAGRPCAACSAPIRTHLEASVCTRCDAPFHDPCLREGACPRCRGRELDRGFQRF